MTRSVDFSKLALGFTAAGVLAIFDSRVLWLSHRMLRNRPSEVERSRGEGYRKVMGPALWLGAFLVFVGLVLFLLSLVET